MHILKKAVIAGVALVAIGLVSVGIYFFPMIAVLLFLGSVLLIWFLRLMQGDRKRAWKGLLKSLFLDW